MDTGPRAEMESGHGDVPLWDSGRTFAMELRRTAQSGGTLSAGEAAHLARHRRQEHAEAREERRLGACGGWGQGRLPQGDFALVRHALRVSMMDDVDGEGDLGFDMDIEDPLEAVNKELERSLDKLVRHCHCTPSLRLRLHCHCTRSPLTAIA